MRPNRDQTAGNRLVQFGIFRLQLKYIWDDQYGGGRSLAIDAAPKVNIQISQNKKWRQFIFVHKFVEIYTPPLKN